MANKMLIDASHPEETRVVVLRGNRVEEFDFEAANKKQLRGNIYLAKVTRVEPSLQAAFVDYGGNRHGFLAFSEIHPDYYQIPVVDRQALIDEEARAQRDDEEEESRGPRRSRRHRRDRNGQRSEKRRNPDDAIVSGEDEAGLDAETEFQPEADHSYAGPEDGRADERFASQDFAGQDFTNQDFASHHDDAALEDASEGSQPKPVEAEPAQAGFEQAGLEHAGFEVDDEDQRPPALSAIAIDAITSEASHANTDFAPESVADTATGPETETFEGSETVSEAPFKDDPSADSEETEDEADQVEQLGGDAMEEVPSRPHRMRKQYKIQEVIKRRQVLLVQVVKEERGNKGAALTTYLSLAGRYSVLMPNTARGGGISRKITDSTDRLRLKSIAQELEVPEGMGVILRTAGASRTKAEVKRDFEYLLRMWETVRETTLKSTAPTLVYEEGSLIKRAIRDLYNKDIDEVVVAGDNGYREAKDFMRLLMPSHSKNVTPYRDPQPIFAKAGAEAQLDAMFSNQVTLRSGGYIVINQTEALVAIDVNSGRSTREHDIEDTALRTNLEASDEVARQLRLRDLAGLIVVDFIDMEENRNNRAVERRLKDALKNDRARIQVGRISHFGLLEMSRQRIRTGVLEGSTVICPHCAGAGTVRSTSSIALHVLRVLEDALIKSASHDITVRTRTVVALYMLNQKRTHLRQLEARFGVVITVAADDALTGTTYHAMERGEPASGIPEPTLPYAPSIAEFPLDEEEDANVEETVLEADEDVQIEASGDEAESHEADGDGSQRRRRRRRRRGRGGDREGSGIAANAPQPSDDGLAIVAGIDASQPVPAAIETAGSEAESDEAVATATTAEEPAPRSRRRRSRRSGRGPREPEAGVDADLGAQDGEGLQATLGFEVPESEAPAQAAHEDEAAPAEARRPQRASRSRSPRHEVQASEPQATDLPVSEAPSANSPVANVPDVHVPADLPGADLPTADLLNADLPTTSSSSPEPFAAQESVAPFGDSKPVTEADTHRAPASHAESEARPASSEPEEHPRSAPETAEETGYAPSSAPDPETDPARPKRSGWWQRAKATLRG